MVLHVLRVNSGFRKQFELRAMALVMLLAVDLAWCGAVPTRPAPSLLAALAARLHAMAAAPPALILLALAGIAGACGAMLVYPFDTLKTRLQSEGGAARYGNGVRAVLAIVRTDGVLSLYRGIGPQLVGVIPEKAVKLCVHEATVHALGEVWSGALAGL